MAEEWVNVGKAGDVSDGAMIEVDLEGKPIAIANVQGTYYAIAGECPHQGGPLAEGELEDTVLTCPWHNFRFDVTNGRTLDPPIGNCAKYAVRVEGEDLQLLNR